MRRLLFLLTAATMLFLSVPKSGAQSTDTDVGNVLTFNEAPVASVDSVAFAKSDSLLNAYYFNKIHEECFVANIPGIDVTWAKWRLMTPVERQKVIKFIDDYVVYQLNAFKAKNYTAIDARLETDLKRCSKARSCRWGISLKTANTE